MILLKLIGYDLVTNVYTDPNTGKVENLPSSAICVSDTILPGYEDISTIENWNKYGVENIGDVVGFKDWMCLRSAIKPLILAICGEDFMNWDNLNTEQKQVALNFLPTKIIDAKGSDFSMTQTGGLYHGKLILDNYQSLSEKARSNRLKTFGDFGYYGLGKDQGLQLERQFQVLALDKSYIQRGVLFLAEDTVDGLGDWVLGTNGFGVIGLKPQLLAGTYNLLPGFPYTVADFCDVLAHNILENGIY